MADKALVTAEVIAEDSTRLATRLAAEEAPDSTALDTVSVWLGIEEVASDPESDGATDRVEPAATRSVSDSAGTEEEVSVATAGELVREASEAEADSRGGSAELVTVDDSSSAV